MPIGMKLNIQEWIVSDTHRHYITEGLALTSRNHPIGWHADQTPEPMDLTEREEDIAITVFAMDAVKAAALWPEGLEVHVERPEQWAEVRPAVGALLGRLAGADEINIYPSPQNTGQY